MSPEVISILALVAMFVLATLLPINIGVMAFVAAFVVGSTVAGMDGDAILSGFPGGLAVTLIGITYLFAIATNNGTIDWLVRVATWAVRGRLVALPWVMFLVAGTLTAFGAVSPAAVAIIAPVALGFAYKYAINPLLMGIMVVHGAQAGGFSPISIYGSITNDIVEQSELPGSPITLFLASLLFNLAIAIVGFVIFGGRALLSRRTDVHGGAAHHGDAAHGTGAAPGTGTAQGTGTAPGTGPGQTPAPRGGMTQGGLAQDEATRGREAQAQVARGGVAQDEVVEEEEASIRPSPYQLLTLVGLVGLGVATLIFELDVGLVALTVALVLALISPHEQKSAVSQISWPVVLLIAGVLTYVAVLEEIGTIDYVSNNVADLGSAMLASLLLCYVGAVVSAFASSTALLGAIIPLAVPFLLAGEVGAVGVIAALAVSSTVVDVSPFSTNGALVLANAHEDDRDRVYKQLLTFGFAIVLIAPPIAWAVMIAPGWL
ncbi:MAG TPA: SLC13 family permease [Nocardioidaceae bacterium]|nr:SLC13 family permease [Nocardioidaceae bacterium]